jgi:uncharacterized protein (TIGR02996 family)
MTDPDADALLRTIVRHADDDTPRLVYADWLEENGRGEEAEFLRVQCRLAATEPDDPEYPTLLERDEELRLWLTAHVPGPRLAFPAGLSVEGGTHWWWQTHRGYPRFLSYDGCERPGTKAMRSLASAVARAFEVLPTRWLVVGGITVAQLATLLKQRVLSGLREFTLQLAVNADEANEAARLLANCRHLRNLCGLSLAFGIGDDACEALAAAQWQELEWFWPNSHMIGPAGLRALAGANWFRRLRKLTLEEGLPDETFEALARLPALRRLHTLDLSNNDFSVKSWQTFEQTQSFPALAELRLHNNHLGHGKAEALAAARGFDLRVLIASAGCADPGSGPAIAAAPWVASLRALDLTSNWLNASDVRAIVSAKNLRELRHLNLTNMRLSPAALSALAANPALRGLRTLNLTGGIGDSIPLKPGHFDRFLSKLDMPDLRHLDLSERPVGPKAARRLADPKFASLTRLILRGCKLSSTVVKYLTASPTLRDLIQLDLSGNDLGAGAEILADRSVLPRLASCTLANNAIPTSIAHKLRRRPGVRLK